MTDPVSIAVIGGVVVSCTVSSTFLLLRVGPYLKEKTYDLVYCKDMILMKQCVPGYIGILRCISRRCADLSRKSIISVTENGRLDTYFAPYPGECVEDEICSILAFSENGASVDGFCLYYKEGNRLHIYKQMAEIWAKIPNANNPYADYVRDHEKLGKTMYIEPIFNLPPPPKRPSLPPRPPQPPLAPFLSPQPNPEYPDIKVPFDALDPLIKNTS